MKRLLLISSLALASFNVNAQLTCAAPTAITANGTITAPAVTGTYSNPCFGGTLTDAETALKAIWYSYTPTANGVVTVSSNLSTNIAPTYSNDTRLAVFTGTCTALVCYNLNDDSATNYLSSATFPVAAGTTYYISWDNFWNAKGFKFTFTFTESSCLSPNLLDVNDATNIAANSATVSWAAAIGAPANYDVDYGTLTHVAGAGTVVSTATTSANLTGLTTGTDYSYYIRTNCGSSQGVWTGPFSLYMPAQIPYAINFDNATDPIDGTTFDGWNITAEPNLADSGSNFIFSNSPATGTSDAFAFLRPVALVANEAVTLNFKSWYLSDAANTATFAVTVGNAATAEAQTTIVQAYTQAGVDDDFNWVSKTATWTAPTTGIYYFGFHDTSSAADDSSLFVDTITTSSVLSINSFLVNKFDIYPNPAHNTISITNAENITVNTITIADLNGRIVKQNSFNNVSNAEINVSDLSTGMYMMTINSDRGTVTKKVIKN